MKKKYLLVGITLTLLSISLVKAQDLTNYNLYTQNPVIYNPAFAVDNSKIMVFVNTHLQWVGFDGAPRVNTFGIYLNSIKNMGFGLSAYNFKTGLTSSTNVSMNYGYRAILGENNYITFGLALGVSIDDLNINNIVTDNITDPTITDNYYKQTSFSSRLGLSYYYKGFEAQLAMPQLYGREKMNTYTLGLISYDYKIDKTWSLKPQFMLRGVVTSPVQYDMNVKATYQEMVWIQAGYRSNNSLIWGLGFNTNGIDIAYAYQMENSYISGVGKGTHEIQLIYRFGKSQYTKALVE